MMFKRRSMLCRHVGETIKESLQQLHIASVWRLNKAREGEEGIKKNPGRKGASIAVPREVIFQEL